MDIVGILLVRASEAQNGPATDEARLISLSRCLIKSGGNRLHIVPVDRLNKPAIRLKALRDILGEANFSLSSEGDLVVVVEIHKVVELQVPSERSSLSRDPLHEISIAHEREHAVVKEVLAVSSGKHFC